MEPSEKISQAEFEEALSAYLNERPVTEGLPGPERVREGMPIAPLRTFVQRLRLTNVVTARILGISEKTLERRFASARLRPVEADRLWRLQRVYALALQAFGSDPECTRIWLTEPHPVLGGESPVERIDTEAGLHEVEAMLNVIEYTFPA